MKSVLRLPGFCLFLLSFCSAKAQTFNEILCRPADRSMTVSALFSEVVQVRTEFGLAPNQLTQSTPVVTSLPGTPVTTVLQSLQPNTRYYYRSVYKKSGAANFQYGPVRTFHTQRAKGQKFVFTVEADEHLYDKKGIRSVYELCLANQARDSADFMISLGDTFGDDHTPLETNSEDMRALHLDYRQYLGKVCHSMPFLFCLGNHEGESGYWLDQTPPNNIAVYGTQWRKFYYPNPVPDDFYSGNKTVEAHGIGLPENYYAFAWGDALLVVLDVYRDCDINEKPKNWEWTLGKDQYDWLKKTLESSTARHKLVFAHHNRGQGRGGVIPARGCEWGGYGNNGGGAWEFDKMRPGWELPIHQLMVKNGVKIFFQGHDHLYAKEEMDGLTYQTTPMPSDSTYEIGVLANADAFDGLTLDGSGHLRVTVEPDAVTVDYVGVYLPRDTLGAHKNREVRYSYKVNAAALPTNDDRLANSPFFDVFPNPAAEKLSIKAGEAAAYDRTLEIFDLQGRRMRSVRWPAGEALLEINLSDARPGVYTARVVDGSRVGVAKIILR